MPINNDLVVEVFEIERKFAALAAEKGIKEAFLEFAAKDAVINRNNKIYPGKAGITEYYDSQNLKNIKLEWKPDYVDVSASGDMAWTYGNYSFQAESESGEKIEAEGIFHTVWKRQADGSWKYVWD